MSVVPTVKPFTTLVAAETVRLLLILVAAATSSDFVIVAVSATVRVFAVVPPEMVKPADFLVRVRLFNVPVEMLLLIVALP